MTVLAKPLACWRLANADLLPLPNHQAQQGRLSPCTGPGPWVPLQPGTHACLSGPLTLCAHGCGHLRPTALTPPCARACGAASSLTVQPGSLPLSRSLQTLLQTADCDVGGVAAGAVRGLTGACQLQRVR